MITDDILQRALSLNLAKQPFPPKKVPMPMPRVHTTDALTSLKAVLAQDARSAGRGDGWISKSDEKYIPASPLADAVKDIRQQGGRVSANAVAERLCDNFETQMHQVNQRGPSLLSAKEANALGEPAISVHGLLLAQSRAKKNGDAAVLAEVLGQLSAGLEYAGEREAHYSQVHLEGFSGPLNTATLAAAVGADPSLELVSYPVEEFFADQDHGAMSRDMVRAREDFGAMRKMMKAELSDILYVIIGGDDYRGNHSSGLTTGDVYVVGQAADGSVVGLRTEHFWD